MPEKEHINNNNRVLVVGGGLGGIKAALDLAEADIDVVLIDKAPSIGGIMTQLDRTFPTNNCDLCTLSPHLAESSRTQHIDLKPLTTLTALSGTVGQFTATLTTKPRFIDLSKCTACGECFKQFPECVQFTPGLDHRAPTCMRYPQSTPYAFSIHIDQCKDIDALKNVCPTHAIFDTDSERSFSLEVGAVILAPGAELFDSNELSNYGKGMYPNVVTGLEYERILSASGPTGGILARPSDGNQPAKIAWIQCAGSRSQNKAALPYCSSVCCMYGLKEAIVTKERFRDDIETVIFYMDMRTFGKDYELYYQRAKKDFGVRFIRSRPHSIELDPNGEDLCITYVPEKGTEPKTETFDMAVLATGFRIQPELIELASSLGIDVNEYHFAQTDYFHPVETSRKGVYVCGLFESPKDIPETMVQGSAAACLASGDLNASKAISDQDDEEAFVPERDISGEEPRIGIFICDCGYNIGGVINVEDLARYAGSLPEVIVAEPVGHGCSKESLEKIQASIRANKLNRIVIGGCSPRTHENLFQDVIRKTGLNKYLVQMANIRDQVTWVHADQPVEAFNKAKDLIRMATASVALTRPLIEHALEMNNDVLVVGGGVSGMTSALTLADKGFKVYLVERDPDLGGVAKNIRKTIEGQDVGPFIQQLIERTTQHERIEVLTRSHIVDHYGMPGLFTTGLQIGPRMYYRKIQHGVTILATGALPNRPAKYLLDEHQAVMTQMDLDAFIKDNSDRVKAWEKLVMIQCVGSRVPENPNCSRVCCQAAIKNALEIQKINPGIKIIILYRDIRTYGFHEDYYRKAREQGIIFSRYDTDREPKVRESGDRVIVSFIDHVLEREVDVEADCLALSTGFVADEESTEDLSRIFHLPRTNDGYFLEEHIKLRPVDLPIPGFYVAGTAHAPKSIKESIAQAQAAAGRAFTMLTKKAINLGASVARVDGNKCAACLICVRACPFGVPFINADGYSEIDPAKCQGCGVCAAECPAKAIQLMRFEDDRIMAKLNGLLEEVI
ncbi:MAG: CoB--CoM heterodisulfide reductase iron-sulfur subunit A family protein [Deltaproteobacteria bacterium]|nr:CoB--CoM heterodisulfide reductase iron-sulfur subunit A family protein [Deltaproteobacteria bacterium]